MPVRYIAGGDKFKANQLWGEGRHQLSILKNLMHFQNLQQNQRVVRYDDGTIIKCLSCFGHDVINIFVPQPVIGGKPEYKEREEVKYYPALEVYSSPYYGATYKGVVLCKGGGFNPPYEFISKDSLPQDTHTQPLGKLPSERIWEPEYNRLLQDIVPKGIADVELVVRSAVVPSFSAPGGFNDLITRAERLWYESVQYVDCWYYQARSAAKYQFSRTENLLVNYAFSYSLEGDEDPGYWPAYTFEGALRSTDKRPTRVLSLHGTLFWWVQGSGSNNFFQYTIPTYYDVNDYAMRYDEEEGWVRDDANVNFDTITADAIALSQYHIATYGYPTSVDISDFTSGEVRTAFYLGNYGYSYNDNLRYIWDQYGSVMDGDHYALAYSMMNTLKIGNASRSIGDLTRCIILSGYSTEEACSGGSTSEDVTNTEGPLCVVVDGVVFEVFPEATPEDAPRIQDCKLKYFRVGGKGIGLYRIAKNYYEPSDYVYVYADVFETDTGGVETKFFVTPVTTPTEGASAHRIPDVTDGDDNPLYERGGLRLIREEVPIKEMATAEQPGLFREIP